MKVVGAHKGGTVRAHALHGREGHSSAPHKGASAVMMAGEFIAAAGADLAASCRTTSDPRFDPPYTTTQANIVGGGTALNILAREALVIVGVPPPARPRRSRKPWRARRRWPRAKSCRNTRPAHPRPPSRRRSPVTIPASRSIRIRPRWRSRSRLTGANRAETVAYGTEAGHFAAAGIPAVICGPGSIDQAHKADEFVALSELEACEGFLRKVVEKAT